MDRTRTLHLAFTLSFVPLVSAQTVQWAVPLVTDDYCRMYGLDVDAAGNVYVAAEYGGTGDLDPGPSTVMATAAGYNDLLAMKFDATGALQWSYMVGSASSQREWCTGIVADEQGNSWMTGGYAGVVDFDPGPGEVLQAGNSTQAAFLVKLDPNGQLDWVKSFGAGGASRSQSIAKDDAGNIYVGGFLSGGGAFPFGADTLYVADRPGSYGFICRMNAAGTEGWVWLFESSNSGTVVDMEIDANGAVHFVGIISGVAEFDDGAISIASMGQEDVLMGKLDAAGDLAWVRSIGGTTNDVGYSVTVDAAGSPIYTGYITGTVDLDPGPGVLEVTAGGSDPFVLKLDADGDLQWVRTMAGGALGISQSITTDDAGRIYIGGYFSGDLELDPVPGGMPLTSSGGSDQFVAVLDANGDAIAGWATGGASTDHIRNMAVDPAGNTLHAVGFFRGSADIDPGPGTTLLEGSTGDNGMIVRYALPTWTGIAGNGREERPAAWPNPFRDQLFLSVDAATMVEVFDATGRSVHGHRLMPGTTSLDLPRLHSGLYMLRWYAADGRPMMVRVVRE